MHEMTTFAPIPQHLDIVGVSVCWKLHLCLSFNHMHIDGDKARNLFLASIRALATATGRGVGGLSIATVVVGASIRVGVVVRAVSREFCSARSATSRCNVGYSEILTG